MASLGAVSGPGRGLWVFDMGWMGGYGEVSVL